MADAIASSNQARAALGDAYYKLAQKYAALSETPVEYAWAEELVALANKAAVIPETAADSESAAKLAYSLKGLGNYTSAEQLAAAQSGGLAEREALKEMSNFRTRSEMLKLQASPAYKAAITSSQPEVAAELRAQTALKILNERTPLEGYLEEVAARYEIGVSTGRMQAAHPFKMAAAEETVSSARLLSISKGAIPATIAFEVMYRLAAYQDGLYQKDVNSAGHDIAVEQYARGHRGNLNNIPQEQEVEQGSR